MSVAFSVNGKLQHSYEVASVDVDRAHPYTPVKVGEPLVITYKYFSVNWKGLSKDLDKLMISSFVKTTEKKQAEAEAVNFFSEDVPKKSPFTLEDFGAEDFGHPLIYYSPSYLGETVRLTTKVMELDSPDSRIFDSIQEGLLGVSSLPLFVQYLPFAAIAGRALDVVEKLIAFIDKDDPLIKGQDVDLHFDVSNSRKLQSGRFVFVSGLSEQELLSDGYELSNSNRLLHKGAEVEDRTYFVVQVDSKKHNQYKNFDYFFGAADLLKKINRKGDPGEVFDVAAEAFKALHDTNIINDIRDLQFDAADDKKAVEQIKALRKNLSPEIKTVTDDWIKQILATADN